MFLSKSESLKKLISFKLSSLLRIFGNDRPKGILKKIYYRNRGHNIIVPGLPEQVIKYRVTLLTERFALVPFEVFQVNENSEFKQSKPLTFKGHILYKFYKFINSWLYISTKY